MLIRKKARLSENLTLNQLNDFCEKNNSTVEFDNGIPYWILADVEIEKPKIKTWDYLGLEEL